MGLVAGWWRRESNRLLAGRIAGACYRYTIPRVKSYPSSACCTPMKTSTSVLFPTMERFGLASESGR